MANGEKKSKLRLKVLLGFGVALTAVGIAAYINFTSLTRLLTAVETISAPDYKLISLKQLLTDLPDLESNVRSYALTHDEKYFNAYEDIADSIRQSISTLQELTSDNDKQAVLTDSIESLVEQRLELFNFFIEKRKNEFASRLEVPEAGIEKEDLPEESPAMTIDTPPAYNNPAPQEKENWWARNFGSKKKKRKQNDSVVAAQAVVIDSLSMVAGRSDSLRDQMKQELNVIIEQEKASLNEQLQGWSEDEWVLLQQDKWVMDKIRSAINLLEEDEQVIAKGETIEASRVAQDSTFIITIITSLGILSILSFLFLILRDISRSNRLKKQLIEERTRAEKLARVKEEFLANMSHEIRTPLNAIVGFTEQLTKEDRTEVQRNYVHAIHHSAEYLSSLVNQVLSFSKIESGKLKPQSVAFDFYELIREVFEIFRIKAAEKKCLFSYRIEENVPQYVFSDPIICRQIVINLVGNAIKFTEQGSVEISCSTSSPESKVKDIARILIKVRDTGIGIAPEMQDKIFEEFTQAENELSRKYEGTGLGLTITKKLTELLGGAIEVQSAIGSGSVFTVTLPFKVAEKQVQDEPIAFVPESWLRNKSVLVVDDEEMNILLVQTILRSWGIKVDSASSGREALEKLFGGANTVASSSLLYDLVLLDIQMPGMSGTEVVTTIRASTDHRISGLPVIALTANVYIDRLKDNPPASFDEVLMKPFKENELYQKIMKTLHRDHTALNGQESLNESKSNPGEELFSLKYLAKTSGANREFEIRMLELFIQNNGVHIQALKDALQERNWDAIYRLVHKMIPQFRYLEISKTEFKLKRIEQLSGEKKSLEEIPQLIEDVATETERILILLKEEIGKLVKQNGQSEKEEDGMIVDHHR